MKEPQALWLWLETEIIGILFVCVYVCRCVCMSVLPFEQSD